MATQRRWAVRRRPARRPPGVGERDVALAAPVGVACVQAAIDRWLGAPGSDLTEHVDRAFSELVALADDMA